jgi:hypothetical protein
MYLYFMSNIAEKGKIFHGPTPPLYTSLTKDICQTIGDIVQGWIPARAPPKIGKNMITRNKKR